MLLLTQENDIVGADDASHPLTHFLTMTLTLGPHEEPDARTQEVLSKPKQTGHVCWEQS